MPLLVIFLAKAATPTHNEPVPSKDYSPAHGTSENITPSGRASSWRRCSSKQFVCRHHAANRGNWVIRRISGARSIGRAPDNPRGSHPSSPPHPHYLISSQPPARLGHLPRAGVRETQANTPLRYTTAQTWKGMGRCPQSPRCFVPSRPAVWSAMSQSIARVKGTCTASNETAPRRVRRCDTWTDPIRVGCVSPDRDDCQRWSNHPIVPRVAWPLRFGRGPRRTGNKKRLRFVHAFTDFLGATTGQYAAGAADWSTI